VRARKRFGQHFLTDPNILRKIVNAAEIQAGEVVLEIGPGLGHLTRALVEAGARVVAIELDRDLAARLRQEGQDIPELCVLEGDFLANAPERWLANAGLGGAEYKVVANLPYYITSPVLQHLLEARRQPTLLVVMVQREVAKELVARPGNMNLLGLSVQFYGRPRVVAQVPAGAFFPRPKVDSAIIRVQVDRPSRFPEIDPPRFFEIVRAGFGVRRKQLHNALERGLGMNGEEAKARLLSAHIDPSRRAETLSLEEWRRVYLHFAVMQQRPSG
jgi:16S rRNA (adenine1518-N6/adenine1519-N6)-dimethyltransferase